MQTFTIAAWIAGIFAVVPVNLSLLHLALNDKLTHPLKYSFIATIFFALTIPSFAFISLQIKHFWIVLGAQFFVCACSLGFVSYILKERDVATIEKGQELLQFLFTIDIQINYIAYQLSVKDSKSYMEDAIIKALDLILDQIENFLKLPQDEHTKLCILLPKPDGKFSAISTLRIGPKLRDQIESKFQFIEPVSGLAGHTIVEKKCICIPDLAKGKNEEENKKIQKWINLDGSEQKGFIVTYPIMKGVGEPEKEVIAVLCVTSSTKQSLKKDGAVEEVLQLFAPKIEVLLSMMMIEERMDALLHPVETS